MVSLAGAIFMFFQTKSCISYSLFLSGDAGEDEASASVLNLEAGTSAAAVQSCWVRTGSIRRGYGLDGLRRPLTEERRSLPWLLHLVHGRV